MIMRSWRNKSSVRHGYRSFCVKKFHITSCVDILLAFENYSFPKTYPEMNIYPNDSEEMNPDDLADYVPFDGFVNVNELIKNRRALQNHEDNENTQGVFQNNDPEIS